MKKVFSASSYGHLIAPKEFRSQCHIFHFCKNNIVQSVSDQYFKPYIVQNVSDQYFKPYIVQSVSDQYFKLKNISNSLNSLWRLLHNISAKFDQFVAQKAPCRNQTNIKLRYSFVPMSIFVYDVWSFSFRKIVLA